MFLDDTTHPGESETTAPPTRQGGGRRKGWPKGKKRKSEPTPTSGIASKATARADDKMVSDLLLQLFDGIVSQPMVYGPEARLADNERKLIEPPLGRIVSRMGKDAVAKFQALSDPIMLMAGFGMWWMRASTLRGDRVRPTVPAAPRGTQQPTPIRPNAPPPPPPPTGPATDGVLVNDDLAELMEQGDGAYG